MAKAPRYNTTFDYFAKAELTPLLAALIEESAAPLACVESQFARCMNSAIEPTFPGATGLTVAS